MARRVKFGASGPEFSVRHEGALEKLRRFGQRRRYFLLLDSSLVYFRFVPPKYALIPRPEGEIHLATLQNVALDEADARVLKVQVPNKTFFLRAESTEAALQWLTELLSARDAVADTTPPTFTTGNETRDPTPGRELLPKELLDPSGERADVAAERWWKTGGVAPQTELERLDCVLCSKGFSALCWKYFCSICGRPHCDRCSSHAIMRKRVCSVCFVAAVSAAEAEAPDDAVQPDPEAEQEKSGPLGKYAKMESVGVPLHGILQAMKRDGVAPEQALQFAQRRGEAGTTAYAAIYEAQEKSTDAAATPAQTAKKSAKDAKPFQRKTQPFYWNALAKQDSSDSPSGGGRSVWNRAEEDTLAGRHKVTVLQHEQIELETLFKLRTKTSAKSPKRKQESAKLVSFVDNKRAQNVLVVLKRFKCTLPELLYGIAAAPLKKDAAGRPRSMPTSFQ
eukprot:scaffold1798_cov248-Pinguiococcus_pyrenoidosus.AAC.11